jgi:acetyl esterase/lipase
MFLDNELMNKKHFLIMAVMITLSSCGQTQPSLSSLSSSSAISIPVSSTPTISDNPNFLFINQLSYGFDQRQSLEIAYRPNDVSPTPVILFIHGGSWISGDKSIMRRYQDQVIEAGYAYASMNYRFITSGANYLDMLDDIHLAIQLLKDFSNDLNLSVTRMAIVGESAGGHLAMLYSYRNVSPIPIKFLMALVPPVDFTDPGYLSFGDPNIQLLIANGLMATSLVGPEAILVDGYPNSWIDASPISHLTKAIPTLIGYAGLDELIPLSNMQRFLLAASSSNAPVEAILFPTSGHSLNGDPDKLEQLLLTFFTQLNTYLPIVTEI